MKHSVQQYSASKASWTKPTLGAYIDWALNALFVCIYTKDENFAQNHLRRCDSTVRRNRGLCTLNYYYCCWIQSGISVFVLLTNSIFLEMEKIQMVSRCFQSAQKKRMMWQGLRRFKVNHKQSHIRSVADRSRGMVRIPDLSRVCAYRELILLTINNAAQLFYEPFLFHAIRINVRISYGIVYWLRIPMECSECVNYMHYAPFSWKLNDHRSTIRNEKKNAISLFGQTSIIIVFSSFFCCYFWLLSRWKKSAWHRCSQVTITRKNPLNKQ